MVVHLKKIYSTDQNGEMVIGSRTIDLPFAPVAGMTLVLEEGMLCFPVEHVSYYIDGEYFDCINQTSLRSAWLQTDKLEHRLTKQGWQVTTVRHP